MKAIIKITLVSAAVYIAASLYAHGLEGALGGAFSWMASSEIKAESGDSDEAGDVVEKSHFYGNAEGKDGRRKRVPITKAVRSRVSDRMAQGARRNDRALRNSGL